MPSSIVPLTTTTTIAGTPIGDAEIYAQAGLTREQGACIDASGFNGDFTATPGVGLLDPLVLTTGDKMVAVPADVRTSAELEELMLAALAEDCAPADARSRLAAIDGAAIDDAALADDLPIRLEQRKAEGATPAELACIEARFREAPTRLSSLAANPKLVESQCAPAERLAAWRHAALDAGLRAAGATDAERACLVDNPGDLVLLEAAVDAVGSGDASGMQGASPPTCVPGDRLLELSVDITAKGADFGAETLSGA
jgi:hypothetical protein